MPFHVRKDRPWERAGEHKSYSQEMQGNFDEWMSEATGIPDWQEAGLYQDPGFQGGVPRSVQIHQAGISGPRPPGPPPPPPEVAGPPIPEETDSLPTESGYPAVYPGPSFARHDIEGSDISDRMYNLNILQRSLAPSPNAIYPPPQWVNPDATSPMFLREEFPTRKEEEEERERLRRQMEAERQNEVRGWLQRGGWNRPRMS
jgi:hypothetical protein